MKLLFYFLLAISFLSSSCKKECAKTDTRITKRLEGTWNVTEVVTSQGTANNTGEKFIFHSCPENNTCTGIFITTSNIEEKFYWTVHGKGVAIGGYDSSAIVGKYYSVLQSISNCSRNEFVFGHETKLSIKKEN